MMRKSAGDKLNQLCGEQKLLNHVSESEYPSELVTIEGSENLWRMCQKQDEADHRTEQMVIELRKKWENQRGVKHSKTRLRIKNMNKIIDS